MGRALVADLGLGPQIWLFLTFISALTVFFKFTRFWSVRNLDLLLLFALAPGLMQLVGSGDVQPWSSFVWLFVGSGLWLVRCLADLGLTRRPLLEPNLNASGLACAAIGLLILLVAESILLPFEQGIARNPADPTPSAATRDPGTAETTPPTTAIVGVLRDAPLPVALKRNPPQVIVSRVLASLSHLALVVSLYLIGARHFDRPILGLSMAVCYLLSPYTRIAVVDSGQLIPAAFVVGAVLAYRRPALAGLLIGLSAGWMPPCLGLVPLWTGFYMGRNAATIPGRGGSGRPGLRAHRLPVEHAFGMGPRSWGTLPHAGRPLARGGGTRHGQLLDPDRRRLPAPRPHRLPDLRGSRGLVAGGEKPGRAHRAVRRRPHRQSVLVPRRGGDHDLPVPPAHPADDVPAQPDSQGPARPAPVPEVR